jgi:hypothetical protein
MDGNSGLPNFRLIILMRTKILFRIKSTSILRKKSRELFLGMSLIVF